MLHQESRWKASPARAGAPACLRPWLTDADSLTARILARCRDFRVEVLREAHALPCRDESRLLGLRAGRNAWIREVLLIADAVPAVFAHSVLAPRDLIGAWHMARAIGSRPLGAALFADPVISRGPLQSARIAPGHPLHRLAMNATGASLPVLWGRRSLFLRHARPLLVTEVFLPGIYGLS